MNKWIDINERLPETKGDVLAYMPNEGCKIQILYYWLDNLWENGYGVGNTSDFELTHWMPLPEPPTKKE